MNTRLGKFRAIFNTRSVQFMGLGFVLALVVSFNLAAHAAGTQHLTVTVIGNGTVGSNLSSETCAANSTCNVDLATGTAITLTETPASGWKFTGWGGDCAPAGTSTSCSGDMSADHTVTANFAVIPTTKHLTITV